MRIDTDFLVIGSGLAGLTFALKAADLGQVLMITKREAMTTATAWAQGGIAAVIDPDDSVEEHIRDTITAGDGLNDPEMVRTILSGGAKAIQQLRDWGVDFTPVGDPANDNPMHVDLTREGGHSRRRVVHVKDYTGRAVEERLLKRARQHPRITVREHQTAIDLITSRRVSFDPRVPTIYGAYVLDNATGDVHTVAARWVVLATGGAGKAYLYTTNPDIATGDGIAMGYRAGATVANMEFVQFHPTALYHPVARTYLVTEALRGEGAILRNTAMEPFMERYHPQRELAPRDVVARAIDTEIKASGEPHVWLDITHKGAAFIKDHFPQVHETCLKFGIDMTRQPIPVVPAAHYMCGGIQTDSMGGAGLGRLFALGECACTGLHGANRLASNSLLEATVMAHRAFRYVESNQEQGAVPPPLPPWEPGGAVDLDEQVIITHNWDEIRRFMWDYVGIVRTNKRLERALRRIQFMEEEVTQYYWNFNLTVDLIELRNLALVAELIIKSALARKESRGLHFNRDFPQHDDRHWLAPTRLRRE